MTSSSGLDVIAFFAHPDDETMLCGGTIALLTRLGARVHLVIATRGEGGEMGEPPLSTREQLGAVREAELRCAAVALGASSLVLLNYLDPLVGPDNVLYPFAENLDEVVEKLNEVIHKTGAAAILTHGVNGEYGHPAHKLAHQAALQAIGSMSEPPLLFSVMGNFADCTFPRLVNVDAPAHLLLDVTTLLPEKIAAAECHRTQHALFVRQPTLERGGVISVPEIVMTIESLTRVSPPAQVGERLEDALSTLLWQSGLARVP